jgi:kynureninase
VHALQEHFVGALLARGISELPASSLVVPLAEQNRGNFLTYRLQNASTISARLLAHDIVTDVRGDRLRFGFGLYHDTAALDEGIARMARILREPQ